MCQGPSLGSYLLKESGVNKFRNIWHSMCNVCGYCIFTYSALGQVCRPWMAPCTISSVVHEHPRKNFLWVLESPDKVLEFFLSKGVWTLYYSLLIVLLKRCVTCGNTVRTTSTQSLICRKVHITTDFLLTDSGGVTLKRCVWLFRCSGHNFLSLSWA